MSHDYGQPTVVEAGVCVVRFVLVTCLACRRENNVAYSLWLEVRLTVVVCESLTCESLTVLVEAGGIMLVRSVGKVIRRVEGLQLLLLAVGPC